MGSQPIDYDALARQQGAVVDYDALAQQHGGSATTTTDDAQQSPAYRYGSNLLQSLNPIPAIKHYINLSQQEQDQIGSSIRSGDYGTAATAFLKSMPGVDFASDVAKAQFGQFKQAAADLWNTKEMPDLNDRLLSASGHALAGALPLLGPAAAQAGETIGSGDVAGGLGQATALVLPAVAKGYIPAGASVAVVPRMSSALSPTEAAAVNLGEVHGVPMTAATRTGSPIVAGAQKLANYVPGSGAKQALAAQEAGLVRTGERLAEQATGGQAPTVPEMAGKAVQKELTRRIQQQTADSHAAYSDLESMENNPANARGVPSVDPQGNPTTVQMGLPVDMRAAKAALKPLYDQLMQQMPIARQQASYGLKAIENIVNGKDFMPASEADQNLSAMKALQREGANAKAGYLVAKAIDQFSPAVDQAVAQAGPQATQALQDARNLWKAKAATEETLANLETEPVKLVNQLTVKKDAGINLLRDVQSKAPNSLPAVGRAYLDGLMEKAFGEGGKPGTVFTEWNNLGDSTKQILFKDPQVRADLDSFFTLAKKAAENPNPSGTAPLAQLSADGAMLIASHGAAAPYLIGRSALARILMSQGGARALANGLRISVRNPAAATLAANQILRVAGDAAVPANGLVSSQ